MTVLPHTPGSKLWSHQIRKYPRAINSLHFAQLIIFNSTHIHMHGHGEEAIFQGVRSRCTRIKFVSLELARGHEKTIIRHSDILAVTVLPEN